MRRTAAAALALAILALAAPAAQAQGDLFGGGFFGAGAEAGREISQRSAEVAVRGQLVVEFRGDAAAGCAAAGLCDVAGTVVFDPGRQADYTLTESERRGRRRFEATISLGQSRVTSQVTRDGPAGSGTCADARDVGFAPVAGSGRGPGLDLGFAGAEDPRFVDLVRTRCPGPLMADLAGLLPGRRVALGALRRGATAVDLRSERPFAAGGLAGTVRSTLVAEIERTRGPQRPPGDEDGDEDDAQVTFAQVQYRVERVTGALAAGFAGVRERDLCELLDTCGLSGTVRLDLAATAGEGALFAIARGRPGRRALRAGLGIGPGRAPRALLLSGVVIWRAAGAAARVERAGSAAPPCTSASGGRFVAVLLERRGSRLRAGLAVGGDDANDSVRTRCPGPSATDLTGDEMLAAGDVPPRAFRSRRVVLRLRAARPFTSEALAGSSATDVEIVLRRGRFEVESADE